MATPSFLQFNFVVFTVPAFYWLLVVLGYCVSVLTSILADKRPDAEVWKELRTSWRKRVALLVGWLQAFTLTLVFWDAFHVYNDKHPENPYFWAVSVAAVVVGASGPELWLKVMTIAEDRILKPLQKPTE